MKKSVRMILCLALVLASLFCLVACGGGSGSKSSVAGKYKFYSMTMEGETFKASDLEDLGMDPDDIYLKLNKDGTGVMVMPGEDEMDMEWEGDEIWPEGEEDEAVEFSVKGGKLTMEQDGVEMVFKK